MKEFKQYVKSGIAEMRPYEVGEDLAGISIGEHAPSEGGMIVRDPNNHEDQYYVPHGFFTENYDPIQSEAMTFGMAVEVMKQGGKVARAGWNGKGMFVYLVKGRKVPREALNNEAHLHYPLEVTGDVQICDHVDMKAADGSIVIGWLASQTDVLAEDWQIVE